MTHWGPPPQPWQPPPYGTPSGGAAAPYISEPPGRGQQIAAWLLTAACAGLAALLTLVALSGFITQAQMDAVAVKTSATVVDVDSYLGYVYVDYDVRGEKLEEVEVSWSGRFPREGEVVTIEYDPGDLEYARQAGSREDFNFGLGFAVVAAIFWAVAAGATAWGIHAGRSRRRAVESWRLSFAQQGYGGWQPPAPQYPYPPQQMPQPGPHSAQPPEQPSPGKPDSDFRSPS